MELTLHCSGQAEQRQPLAPGVYEIILNYPCSLYGNNWTLSSIFHRTYNATLEAQSVDFNLNMSLSTMFNVTLDLNPNVFDLKGPKPSWPSDKLRLRTF